MTSSGPNYSSAASGVSQGELNTWSNLANAQGSTNFGGLAAGATCVTSISNPDGDYLYFEGFGFSIPAGSTINGIFAEVMIKASGLAVTLNFYQLLIAGSPAGTNFASTPISIPTSATNLSQGGSSTLWGLTPTAAQVNASTFGFMVEQQQTGGSRTTTVYGGRMTITYTPPVGGLSAWLNDQSLAGGMLAMGM